MRVLLSLAGRNMRLYFRDRASVFLSMLSALIVLLLYALFLSSVQADGIAEAIPQANRADIEAFVNAWVVGGILAISTVTTALGALGVMVDDNTKGVMKDFRTAPISRTQLMGSYILAGFLSSAIINTVLFVVAEGYIVLSGGALLAPFEMAKVIGLILLCCAAFTAISATFVTITKTPGAFGGLSTIMGTLMGFLSGTYMPVGIFPAGVQAVVKVMPFTYAASLFRQIFTKVPMEVVFKGAPESVLLENMEYFGLSVNAFGYDVQPLAMLAIIAATGLLFFAIAVWRMSKQPK